MIDSELLIYATQFELPRFTRIVKSPVIFPDGQWYVQRGIMLLHRQHGWLISNQISDPGFLFTSPNEAANFAILKEHL